MTDREYDVLVGALAELKAGQAALLEKVSALEGRGPGDVDPHKAYSCEQAARFLGLSRYTVWKRVQAGVIPKLPQPAGSNAIRIRGKAIIALLTEEAA